MGFKTLQGHRQSAPSGFEALLGVEMRIVSPWSKRPIGSKVVPFWGYLYRILNINHKKELLWSPWVLLMIPRGSTDTTILQLSPPI